MHISRRGLITWSWSSDGSHLACWISALSQLWLGTKPESQECEWFYLSMDFSSGDVYIWAWVPIGSQCASWIPKAADMSSSGRQWQKGNVKFKGTNPIPDVSQDNHYSRQTPLRAGHLFQSFLLMFLLVFFWPGWGPDFPIQESEENYSGFCFKH